MSLRNFLGKLAGLFTKKAPKPLLKALQQRKVLSKQKYDRLVLKVFSIGFEIDQASSRLDDFVKFQKMTGAEDYNEQLREIVVDIVARIAAAQHIIRKVRAQNTPDSVTSSATEKDYRTEIEKALEEKEEELGKLNGHFKLIAGNYLND